MTIARIHLSDSRVRVVGQFETFGAALKFLHDHHRAAFLADEWSIINATALKELSGPREKGLS